MKHVQDAFIEEDYSSGRGKRKLKISQDELEDLREHIDSISFNLGKVYHHAKERSRKQSLKNSLKSKIHHSYRK